MFLFPLAPIKIKRYTRSHQQQADARFVGAVDEGVDDEVGAEDEEQGWHDGVADDFVGAGYVGHTAAEQKNAHGGGPVENKRRENEHVRQGVEGAGDDQHRGPGTLQT